MHLRVQDVPGANPVWAGMAVGYNEMPAGTDFTPFFEGLPDNVCSCPHWGYVTKGAVHIRYTDGTVEVIPAGNVFYWTRASFLTKGYNVPDNCRSIGSSTKACMKMEGAERRAMHHSVP